MKQTTDKQVNALQNDNGFTPGEWEATEVSKNQVVIGTKNYGTNLPNGYRKDNKCGQITVISGWNGFNISELSEEDKANAALIASAPTLKAENEKLRNENTELFQMVKDLKNSIKRITNDEVLTQYDKDTEAQWEGEAHELLIRINPNYYKNANE